MDFNETVLNELQDSMKKDINSMLEKQINEYVKKQMEQLKQKYIKEMVSVDTYPTDEELDAAKKFEDINQQYIKGYALDGMMSSGQYYGDTPRLFYGITSQGQILHGPDEKSLIAWSNNPLYNYGKIQPITNEYIDIIKCIMKNFEWNRIFESGTNCHHIRMQWADELMDIFRKYHPRREPTKVEGDINSIMKKLLLKTHPDKGGNVHDSQSVNRVRELIKEA